MVAFSSLARLPMLRCSVCSSLMGPLSRAGKGAVRGVPGAVVHTPTSSASTAWACSVRGRSVGDVGLLAGPVQHVGVRLAAVVAAGHPDGVVQAADRPTDRRPDQLDGSVRGCHPGPNGTGT